MITLLVGSAWNFIAKAYLGASNRIVKSFSG
jgi:hypothetical protein